MSDLWDTGDDQTPIIQGQVGKPLLPLEMSQAEVP